ncbi:sulfite exporter TauE/SafE family protein [Aliiglaciecola sp. CAU 1673]|uniref:sulfite exporter TauE/SafE family protein n=1 Tax=Aliiglaciecola sp. CAU 1673 TaxID=3032595 RepID=UPI0023DA5827|nr:sulfite exporter TauE/SafE family protein [Aliiglaciecola sp. CAU 1673]MDF2180113.1 sulfite exporter TauE/SafE family protein [Aliiglaciecola sp. CAU 1673]
MDLSSLPVVVLVVLLTGISKSGFAGALGVFSVPLLMLALPPKQAIGFMLPLLLLADFFAVKSHWRQWDWGLLKTLLPGALLGVSLGSLLLGLLPTEILSKAVGLLALLFALRYLLWRSADGAWLSTKAAAWGMSAMSGLSSTLIHAGGPPLMMLLIARQLAPALMVATSTVFFASLNLAKLVPFVGLGLLDSNLLLWAAALSPVAWLGNRWGIYLRERLPVKTFLLIMHSLLLVLGLKLMIS